MSLKKIETVDIEQYKKQTMVRRRVTCNMQYQSIGIMVDADVDG